MDLVSVRSLVLASQSPAQLTTMHHSFWTALPFTFATVRASMKASKEASSGVTA